MSFNFIPALAGWLLAMAIFFSFIVALRYLHHREKMALISKGIHPEGLQRQRRSRGMLRAGLITTMVGLALTIGLYPIGFFLPPTLATPFHLCPWLLPGLIPLGVGMALICSYYLEQNSQSTTHESRDNITPFEERGDRERNERS